MSYWVYILRSEDTGRYYTGSTEDIDKRVIDHNGGRVESTRAYRPWLCRPRGIVRDTVWSGSPGAGD
jgi:hypothetical protein